MGLTSVVLDAAVEEAGPAWDEAVVAADLPAAWHAGPVTAFARASREAVLTVRVDDAGRPALLACYRTGTGPGRVRYRDLRPRSRPRAVVLGCSPPVSFDPGFAFVPGVARADRGRLLAEADRAVRRRVGPWCRAVVYQRVGRADRDLFAGARLSARVGPVAYLPVTWSDLDGYLAGLPRHRARRLGALAERIGSDPDVVAFGPGADLDPVAASRLEVATRLRHLPPRTGAAPLPAAYFDALLATGRAGAVGFRRLDGTLLQFDLLLPAADRATTTATGAEDRSAASDLYAALYLSEIAWAGAAGVPALSFGPGALAEKRRFGCRTDDRWTFLATFG